MSHDEPVVHIKPAQRTIADPAMPGMVREQAVAKDNLWSGLARTAPGMDSGWHHHGEHESVIFIVSGSLRMESGPGGSSVLDAQPGDFLYVPAGAVHRELNPGSEESQIVVTRAGHGPTTVNVDGPASASR